MSELDQIIAEIKAAHRRRRYALRMQQSIDRPLEAFIRVNEVNFSTFDDADARAEAVKKARQILAKAKKGEGSEHVLAMVEIVKESRRPWDKMRQSQEKELERLAGMLPVAEWVKSIDGAGLLGLATIVGETGDLSKYANPAKIWKRLGFAPYDGLAGSTWKRESWRPRSLSSEEWIDNPFSGERYSLMYVIALWLKNAQWIGAAKTDDGKGKPNGVYGRIYAARRERTAITHPDWSKGHAHADALRVMMKEYLKELWIEWNKPAIQKDAA